MAGFGEYARVRAVRFARRWGRQALLTPEAARFGNNLYFWLAAWRTRSSPRPLWLTRTNSMLANLEWFPSAEGLTLRKDELGRLDTRLSVPEHHYQRFGLDFSAEDLEGFVRDVVLTSSRFQYAMERATSRVDTTTVLHIRRGDYYSSPLFRPRYAMDLESYLQDAVNLARSQWDVRSIAIVSDDPAWCVANQPALERLGVRISLPSKQGSALDDFAVMSVADHLILSNSSFSQWGAHVNGVLHGDPSRVIAPTFGVRDINAGRAWQLNPAWLFVDNAVHENSRVVD